jgi:UDP-N-acetylmuramyl pentapeptide phosphotransferase/UDP-N-acetylglucosamine-1-phosphate transferase
MPDALLLAFIFSIAALVAWAASFAVKSIGVVDAPDGDRKFQPTPVPRLGGLAILAGIVPGLAAAALLNGLSMAGNSDSFLSADASHTPALLLAALAFAAIGLADDISNINAKLKLGLLCLVCIGAPLLGLRIEVLETPFGELTILSLLITGSALWLLTLTNAANFMDGSNGLSMGSLAIMIAGLGAAHAMSTGTGFPPGLAAPLGAVAGFLVHNMRGTIYAGDIGAFALSGLFALLALVCGLSAWTVATLALPFLVDTLLTLVLRAKRGESLLKAHRDHAYQSLLRAGWSHCEVAVLWWGLTAACAASASVAAAGGGALPFWLFWGLTGLLSGLWALLRIQLRHILAGR